MTPRPSAERYQRLGATILVPVDQKRNSSSAVDELRSIKMAAPSFIDECFGKAPKAPPTRWLVRN